VERAVWRERCGESGEERRHLGRLCLESLGSRASSSQERRQ